MTIARVARFFLKHGYSKEIVQRWLSVHLGRKIRVTDIHDLANKVYLSLMHTKYGDHYYIELLDLWRQLRREIKGYPGD
jgi:hypothetical protein